MFLSQISPSDFGIRDWKTYTLVGLSLFVLTVALLRFSLFAVSKIFEALCDWFDYAAARRQKRQRSLRRRSQQQPGTSSFFITKARLANKRTEQ